MNNDGSNSAKPSFTTNEIQMVWLLCLLAAIHVFIYAAAFPFFNNVDEPVHFDLVLKYAHGDIPRRLETYSDESVTFFALYGAPFYLATGTNGEELLPQPWKLPPDVRASITRIGTHDFQVANFESSQPPLYYALAGAVWRLADGVDDLECLGAVVRTPRSLPVPTFALSLAGDRK